MQEVAPELEREDVADCGHACNEVVFEGLDGMFCDVDHVAVWFCELDVHFMQRDAVLKNFRAFIIHHI